MDDSRTINVLGVPYQIVIGGTEPGEDGSCSPSLRTIRIRDGLCPEKMSQVIYHELVHAILDQLSYSDLYEDECLVQGLAIGLHQALGEPTFRSVEL